MIDERGEKSAAGGGMVAKGAGFLGSLKDALLAAGRDEMPSPAARVAAGAPVAAAMAKPAAVRTAAAAVAPANPSPVVSPNLVPSPSAEEAARMARTAPAVHPTEHRAVRALDAESVPTTRVVRAEPAKAPAAPARTELVRGRRAIERGTFAQDPVVGFLVVVGGPGLGAFRPIFEGNNTVGRATSNRIPLDFGDDAISADAQAYIRYDSNDRSFLFVPNLAKTNVVSLNDKKPTAAIALKPMDVITLGRTQVAFVAFCGTEFDWSEISET